MKLFHWIGTAVLGLALVASVVTAQNPQGRDTPGQSLEQKVELPTRGVAVLSPTEGSKVRGVIQFEERQDAVYLTGKVVGLSPGLHGFHIHEFGDLRDPKGASAGDHFNPSGAPHGAPHEREHHAGDFGNIEADQNGVAVVEIKAPWLKLHFVVGRAVVVHEGEDDLKSQPSGDAGGRAALGVIGIADARGPAERTTAR